MLATGPLQPQLTCGCGCIPRTSSRPGPSSQPACARPAGGTCRGTTPLAHPRRPRSGTPRRAACQAGCLALCRLSISAGRPRTCSAVGMLCLGCRPAIALGGGCTFERQTPSQTAAESVANGHAAVMSKLQASIPCNPMLILQTLVDSCCTATI